MLRPLSACLLFAMTSCLFATEPSETDIEFFEKSVRPILVEHCYECHSSDEANGGLLLDSRAGWQLGGDSGQAILPGDVDHSLFVEAIRYRNHDLQMPPESRMADPEIATLEKWVAIGAPDPRESTITAPAPTGMSLEDGREFWSLQPVADPAVPSVKNPSWVRNPVDAFVLASLEQSGLTPSPESDRRTWIRRVSFNLTGLPPTPSEVEDFLLDDSPAAYSQVVERLLMSPQYGVRWGRHWLDIARYADSNGLDENLAYGNAWRYRDYVFESFNQDKPFDRFLTEQIAGDLLPDADMETKTATGFLSMGAKVLAEPDTEKLIMDLIDEQLDSTGKAFLGMTLGCVRCHDHKFDPIKQSDYYALAAIFKSSQTLGSTKTGAIKHWHEHVFASDEKVESLREVDTEIKAKKSAATKFKNAAMTKLRDEAKSHAVEYLKAAVQFEPGTSLSEVREIARPLGLHPRILHHCRLHLHYHADDPFFAIWHEISKSKNDAQQQIKLIDQRYRKVLADCATTKEQSGETKTQTDEMLEAARAALEDKSGFLAVPPKPEFAFDDETLVEYDRLMEEARVFESHAADVPAAMGVTDGDIQPTLPIHIRGSHRNLGDPIDREFPSVMRWSNVRPIFPTNQSGRLELARWMSSTQHPLTARVYVNRVWRWHFGVGLVSSTENFGVLGDRPSHPKLLDWLARRFMESGWSTKELHRLILSSNTYRMSTHHPNESAGNRVDPENRLLWKFRMQRLESEQIRDAILASAGRLDQSLGGKTVPLRNRQFVFNHTSVDHTKYDSLRRAAFLPVIRNNLYTLFEQFDFPDPTMPSGDRKSTTVAPQALFLMNSELVMQTADTLAEDLLSQSSSVASRISEAYTRVLGRKATEIEIKRATRFIDDLAAEGRTNSSEMDPASIRRAWSLFCQSLFASNEFIFLR